jgi:hypothetical protein
MDVTCQGVPDACLARRPVLHVLACQPCVLAFMSHGITGVNSGAVLPYDRRSPAEPGWIEAMVPVIAHPWLSTYQPTSVGKTSPSSAVPAPDLSPVMDVTCQDVPGACLARRPILCVLACQPCVLAPMSHGITGVNSGAVLPYDRRSPAEPGWIEAMVLTPALITTQPGALTRLSQTASSQAR